MLMSQKLTSLIVSYCLFQSIQPQLLLLYVFGKENKTQAEEGV